MWYLDCYFYGAMLGESFPVNTYGPASREEMERLKRHFEQLDPLPFDRCELTQETKGQAPQPNPLKRNRRGGS